MEDISTPDQTELEIADWLARCEQSIAAYPGGDDARLQAVRTIAAKRLEEHRVEKARLASKPPVPGASGN
jgi:hypothetical protein